VYLSFECAGTYYISTHNLTSTTFTHFVVDSTVKLTDFVLNANSIFLFGTNLTSTSELLLTSIIDEIVTSNSYLTVSTSNFNFALNAGLTFVMVTEVPVALGSTISETLTPTANTGSSSPSLTNTTAMNEISYYTSSKFYTGLAANETRSEGIFLT
jgi:hypothetical protein